MTAHRMMDLTGDTIGFQQQDAPVTNTLHAARLPDGNVEVSFSSTWAQAGASHQTDGAVVLSADDARALGDVLRPPLNFAFRKGYKDAVRADQGDRSFMVEPFNHEHLINMCKGQLDDDDLRAALIKRGWLPPERLEAIAASWDHLREYDTAGCDVGDQLRKEFAGGDL